MPDYSKTVIYKIQHEDDESLVYVGSTNNFTKRKYNHKYSCNNPNKEYNKKLYQLIRDNGGWECFRMVQVKEFPCKNKREAEKEEDRIMMEMKANMNDIRASRSRAEYHSDKRDKINKYKKQYYIKNRDKILEELKEKNTCECGCVVSKNNTPRHKQSKKHLVFIKQSQ